MLLFSIFGDPVTHSISPRLHNTVLNALNLNGCYVRKTIKEPEKLLATFRAMNLQGANVTVPHKEVAYAQCDEVRGLAKEIGAVNTLVSEGARVIGYNTDAQGFYEAIKSFGYLRNALILGAGGTAKAIAMILKTHQIETTILNRSASRLAFFEAKGFTCNTWETFTCNAYDLIINTTSAGLKEEVFPCDKTLLETLFQDAKYAFDVIYNTPTPFLELARSHQLTCKDGKEMLLYQGVLAFNLFFSKHYDVKTIESLMRPAFDL
ncbi:shikimate dehydrogenase [Sulfurospirillum multivorans]|uniref:Shikimate dehydrogenase (NADP(+)) n=2 Tax=Sulfurospirillum multivorans TaxID=66821 RepID=A0AA86DXG9_SULMK|nr:shikimate dehydrogenase [Sulfurospirillum multivorans]AHJ12018.1 shikimate 5-dehydrogenase I alpha [Sulfurospirillum multivorans DSM 12446]QEH05521.1 shikimate 5-dehydrogenase I alpha [Sulfurospirillum multivorans]